MNKLENVNELAMALSKAIVNIPTIPKSEKVDYKTKDGRQIKYNYAPLPEINKAITKPLAEQGLVIVHSMSDGKFYTRLIHVSGQYLESSVDIGKYALGNIKDFGSEQTYIKRYQIDDLLNLASEDDNDAERIEDKKMTEQKVETKSQPKQSQSKVEQPKQANNEDKPVSLETTIKAWYAKYLNIKEEKMSERVSSVITDILKSDLDKSKALLALSILWESKKTAMIEKKLLPQYDLGIKLIKEAEAKLG